MGNLTRHHLSVGSRPFLYKLALHTVKGSNLRPSVLETADFDYAQPPDIHRKTSKILPCVFEKKTQGLVPRGKSDCQTIHDTYLANIAINCNFSHKKICVKSLYAVQRIFDGADGGFHELVAEYSL
jgi:hypothetical protein